MIAHQSLLSMGFSRQEYWSGLPLPSPGDLLDPGIKPSLLHCQQILYHWATREAPPERSTHPEKATWNTQSCYCRLHPCNQQAPVCLPSPSAGRELNSFMDGHTACRCIHRTFPRQHQLPLACYWKDTQVVKGLERNQRPEFYNQN